MVWAKRAILLSPKMNEILQKVHEGDYSFLDHFSLESLDDFQTEEVRKILQSSMKLVELSLDSKIEKLQGWDWITS